MTVAETLGTSAFSDDGRPFTEDERRLWLTRCPVPTAVGIAIHRRLFDEELAVEGVDVAYLPNRTSRSARRRHLDHQMVTLLREGGNVPAIWTRASGTPTRLLGLTWVDERQVLVGRRGERLDSLADLRGKRLAVPRRNIDSVDVFRAMALQGFAGALQAARLRLRDVRLVDVPGSQETLAGQWEPELQALARGDVDVVYVKGAVAVDAVARHQATILVDLDTELGRQFRVNNGTPRPITARQELLDQRPEVVVRLMVALLRAAHWGQQHPDEVTDILAAETGAAREGAAGAYTTASLLGLEPTLSAERLSFLVQQKDFLLEHGFLASDFSIHQWVDRQPLTAAWDIVRASERG